MNTIKATLGALATPTIAAMALWVTPVFAQEDPCTIWGELAATIMELRQGGINMGTAMNATDNELARMLVIAAYETPRFSTEGYKQQAIEDFANEVMMVCYKELG